MMRKIIRLITLLIFVLSISISYAQNYSFQEKTITGVFEAKGKNKTEIFNSISKWIALNYNSAQDVVQLKNSESGTIIVKGINVSTFKNARKQFYQDKYQEENSTAQFNHTMEINVKDEKFRVIYELTDVYNPSPQLGMSSNTEVLLIFDMLDFTELKQNKVDNFNNWVDELWKSSWISKRRRQKFMSTTRPFMKGLIEGVKLNIQSTMNSIYESVIKTKKDDW